VFHARLRRWLQPGGHLEPTDDSIVAAARREVLEETGVIVDAGPDTRLVAVDVHDIPAGRGEPAHRHHDLMFGFVARGWAPLADGGALRAAWCPVDRLGDFAVDEPLRRAVARAGTMVPALSARD
jgi:8-oxo-dGTP pyrophosphatase MutT (NUDIX family)